MEMITNDVFIGNARGKRRPTDLDITPLTKMILNEGKEGVFDCVLKSKNHPEMIPFRKMGHIDGFIDENIKFIFQIYNISRKKYFQRGLRREVVELSCYVELFDASDIKSDPDPGDIITFINEHSVTYETKLTWLFDSNNLEDPLMNDYLSCVPASSDIIKFIEKLVHWCNTHYANSISVTRSLQQKSHNDNLKLTALSSLNKLDIEEFVEVLKEACTEKLNQGDQPECLKPCGLYDIVNILEKPEKFKVVLRDLS